MRINEIADYHELWGTKFIDIDNVYDRLQFFKRIVIMLNQLCIVVK